MRFQFSIFLGVAFIMGNLHSKAQQAGLEYDTELQTDFRNNYNWVNLLRLNASINVSPDLALQASTISVAKTNAEPIIDDLQGFSNIEEDGFPLSIAVLGAEFRIMRSSFFLGIRNVNEDYFTSPVTSLFVNSSCGIFPTISGNYDLANYPLSSWCIHYKAQWEKVALQTSLYEGLGHRRLAGHDNIFRFSPRRDGIFSITSIEYDNNGSNYSMGCALYYGMRDRDEDGVEMLKKAPVEAPPPSSRTLSCTPWINIEQRLSDACSIMAQASVSTAKINCRHYLGLGAAFFLRNVELGLFADYAKYCHGDEIAAELTCRIPLTKIATLQPTIEYIRTNSHPSTIALMRLSISL